MGRIRDIFDTIGLSGLRCDHSRSEARSHISREWERRIIAVLVSLCMIFTTVGCSSSASKQRTISDRRETQQRVIVSTGLDECADASEPVKAINFDESVWDPNKYGSREEYVDGTKDALLAIANAVGYKYPSTVYATMFFEGGMTWSDGKFKETTALKRHTLFGICCSSSEDPDEWKYWDDGTDPNIKAGNGMTLRLYKSYANSVYDYFAWVYRNSGGQTTWNGKKYNSYMEAMNDGKDANEAISLRNGCGYCRKTEEDAKDYAKQAMGCVPQAGKDLDSKVQVGTVKNIEETNLSSPTPSSGAKNSAVRKNKDSSGSLMVGDTVQEQCWNYLKSQGLNDIAAAAVLGNIQGESGFKPDCEGNFDNEYKYRYERNIGFFQFTHASNSAPPSNSCSCEYCQYIKWAGSEKCEGVKQLQWAFEAPVDPEGLWSNRWDNRDNYYGLSYAPSYTAEEFVNANDIEKATYSWMASYEGPSNECHHLDTRISAAKEFYEQFKGHAATNSSEVSEACTDSSGNQTYGNAGTADGEKYHQGQGTHYHNGELDSNAGTDSDAMGGACGATSFAVAVNVLLGEVHKYCGCETFHEIIKLANGRRTSTFYIAKEQNHDDWKTYGEKWLTSKNLDNIIEINTDLELNTTDGMQKALEEGYVLVMSNGSGTSSVYRHADGTISTHPKGHYIMFYKYENGTFYANDSARREDSRAGCPYTTEQMASWLKASGGGGSKFGMKRK